MALTVMPPNRLETVCCVMPICFACFEIMLGDVMKVTCSLFGHLGVQPNSSGGVHFVSMKKYTFEVLGNQFAWIDIANKDGISIYGQ